MENRNQRSTGVIRTVFVWVMCDQPLTILDLVKRSSGISKRRTRGMARMDLSIKVGDDFTYMTDKSPFYVTKST